MSGSERFKSGRESVEDFMDYNGIVHHEFLPEGQLIRSIIWTL